MIDNQRAVRFLIVTGSLRQASLNGRLAALAADIVAAYSGTVDRAQLADKHYRGLKKQWVEFLGERPDVTIDRVETTTMDAA